MHTEGRSQHIHDDHHHDVIGDEKKEKENHAHAERCYDIHTGVDLCATFSSSIALTGATKPLVFSRAWL